MQNDTNAVDAMAKAVTFETYNRASTTPEQQANVVIEQLAQAGFEIVPKAHSPHGKPFRSVAGALFYDPKAPCDIEAIAREVRALRNIVPPLFDDADRGPSA